MGSNEKFCLRWNDFESNMHLAFQEIREQKNLFDCTLSCGARQIQAHKLVLAACSPFFRNVFNQNPHHHPLLYLKGIQFTNLQSILNFIYHGEVNIAKEELNSFLAVAEDLQVKGLTENAQERQKIHYQNENPILPYVSTPASFSQQNTPNDSVHEELPIVKLEADQQPHQEAPHQPSIYVNTIQEVTELENENFEESYAVGDDFDMHGLVPNEQTDDYEGSNIDAGFADTSKGRICIVNPKDWNFVELQS